MKALQGIEGRVEWAERTSEPCGSGQIRIRVAAAGLNRADLLQRAGHYPPPPGASDILGLECAGVVSEVGAGSPWRVGDRACALLAGGGMAEEVVVHAGHGLDYQNVQPVAAIPEIVELNIGHAIIARALFCGMAGAVRDMKALMLAVR